MTSSFGGLGLQLLGYVIGAVLLLGVLKLGGAALDLLPMSTGQRRTLKRIAPLLGAALVLGYGAFLVRSLFRDQPRVVPIALLLIAGGFVAAAWGPLKDLVAGVFLKAGRVCSVGDSVQVGDVSGRVTEVGHRALTLETSAGELVVVPFSVVSQRAVSKVPVLTGAQAHVFELTLPENVDVADALREMQNEAMRHHWSSVVKVPTVRILGGRACRVTVFPLTIDHGTEIEELLRRKFSN